MSEFFKNLLLTMIIPLLETQGKSYAVDQLDKIYQKDPRMHSGIVIGAHLLVDAVIEDLVAKTATKIDDKVVADIKEVLETSAANHNITLPVLPPKTVPAPPTV